MSDNASTTEAPASLIRPGRPAPYVLRTGAGEKYDVHFMPDFLFRD